MSEKRGVTDYPNLTLMKTVEDDMEYELTELKYLEWLEENYVDDGIYG